MKNLVWVLCLGALAAGCRSGRNTYAIKEAIPKSSNVAILIEGENDLKNAVFTEFMNAGYAVKAFNATDFYTTDDVLDVKALKKTAFVTNLFDPKNSQRQVAVADKVFENIYKLHLFNFENLKAEMLQSLRTKMGVRYVILLSLTRWDTGYAWARAIKLDNMELVYVQNYSATRKDDLKSVVGQMIETMQKGK
ncbi:MAG: hypothetical protein J0L53_14680 [Spirochaetes bacterium]|nr:hypothetical protein [Spirochaetota bacterium]